MINTKYKDSLFHSLFGTDKHKDYSLNLYNALSGTHYTDLDELEVTTIEDVVYMGRKNDASVIVGMDLDIWEQQSTYNPNMPLRELLYLARQLDGYITRNDLDVFSSTIQRIPTPRLYVFYNGDNNRPEKEIQSLSQAYEGVGDVEVNVTVLNINNGMNQELLEKCQPLRHYATLINRIKLNKASGMSTEEAVDSAINSCIAEGILSDYLSAHKAEVIGMLLTEWNEVEYRAKKEKENLALRREAAEANQRAAEKDAQIAQLQAQLAEAEAKIKKYEAQSAS